jgi:putative membrane protein
MLKNKTHISIAVLIIFHLVGIGGILLGDPDSFLRLTPLNLLITFSAILYAHVDWKSWWIIPITWASGFAVEVIGVNTGFPFGAYVYEHVLGWQWINTPLIIGINWFILLYGSIAIARRLGLGNITTALVAGALMVFLDYFIEPVAIRFDFWEWTDGHPPLENYIAWFVIASLLAYLWQRVRWQLNTRVGIAVYATQLVFFGILNLLPQ